MSWDDKTDPNRVEVFRAVLRDRKTSGWWRLEAQWDEPMTTYADSSPCPVTWVVGSRVRMGEPRKAGLWET